MMKLIKKLFCGDTITKLEKEVESLKVKLVEKQDVINQTNAYWKKKLYNSKKKSKTKPIDKEL